MSQFGDTPLHTAARYGHAGATRILLSARCQVSQQNKNGDTALHIAAAMGKRKLTRLLVAAGVDITVRNNQGETGAGIAGRKQLAEVVAIIASQVSLVTNHTSQPSQTSPPSQASKPSSAEMVRQEQTGPLHQIISELSRPDRGSQASRSSRSSRLGRRRGEEERWRGAVDEKRRGGEEKRRGGGGEKRRGEERISRSGRRVERRAKQQELGSGPCDCSPLLERLCARMQADRAELASHLELTSGRVLGRLARLERRAQAEVRLTEVGLEMKAK